MLQHRTATTGTDLDIIASQRAETILPAAWRRWIWCRWGGKQLTTERQLGGPMTIGEETDVADAVEAVGHGVLQKTADEFVGWQRHYFGLAVLAIVLPGEADLPILEPDQTAVGDGDTVGVAGEIAEHLFGPGKRRLGEDDPVDLG